MKILIKLERKKERDREKENATTRRRKVSTLLSSFFFLLGRVRKNVWCNLKERKRERIPKMRPMKQTKMLTFISHSLSLLPLYFSFSHGLLVCFLRRDCRSLSHSLSIRSLCLLRGQVPSCSLPLPVRPHQTHPQPELSLSLFIERRRLVETAGEVRPR